MSRDSDLLPFALTLGGAALVTIFWPPPRRRLRATATPPATSADEPTQAAPWIVPVPTLEDRHAVISDGFGSLRTRANGTTERHLGVDLMFRRRDARDLIAVYPPGTPNGSKGHFMPDGVPALAASSGVVAAAKLTTFGHSVIIRHPGGWATYYTHLSTLVVRQGDRVTAGHAIGTIGASPTDPAHLKHLHFELWPSGVRSGALDPGPYIAAWPRVVVASVALDRPSALAPRNAGLVFRPVGDTGDRYPDWLQRVRGESGVYVIRERDGEVVYVGQSSTGRLYETVTRHLQLWRRWKGFWRERQFAEGHDPGLTYERGSVEIAVKVTSPNEALDEEARLIRRLRPRDNILGQPDDEEVPF